MTVRRSIGISLVGWVSVLAAPVAPGCAPGGQGAQATDVQMVKNYDYSGTNIPKRCQNTTTGNGLLSYTLTGGTSIDGAHENCAGALANGSFQVGAAEQNAPDWVWVTFDVPQTAYAGDGTYSCGSVANAPPNQYCDISVYHSIAGTGAGTGMLIWSPENDPSSGPHPDCQITVATPPTGATTGTFHCSALRDSGQAFGDQMPDVGLLLTVDGTFEFPPPVGANSSN